MEARSLHWFHLAKVKLLAGLVPSEGSTGNGNSSFGLRFCLFFCLSFPISGGLLHYLAYGLFLPSLQPLVQSSMYFCSQISLCLPLIRTLVNIFRVQPIIQISRSHLKILSLITPAESLFHKVTFIGCGDSDVDICRGPLVSASQDV